MYFRNKITLAVLFCSLVFTSVLFIGLIIVYPSSVFEPYVDIRDKNDASKISSSDFEVFSQRNLEHSETVIFTSFLPINSVFETTASSPIPGQLQIPYVDIETESLTPKIAGALNLYPVTRGEIVTSVAPGGPGERAGVRAMNFTQFSESDELTYSAVGDIILTIDGSTSFATDFDNLEEYVYEFKRIGENMTLTVLRNGQIKDIVLTVGELPKFQWYENQEQKFKLKYPMDWTVTTNKSDIDGEVIVAFTPLENKKLNRTVFTVTVTVYPTDKEGAFAFGKSYNTNEIRILDTNSAILGNRHGYMTVFNDYSMEVPMKVMTVFALRDVQLYRIDYRADFLSYEDYLHEAKEIISSFQFVE